MTELQAFLRGKQTTLTALARQAGVSTAQLSRVAAGRSRPSLALAKRLEAITDGELSASSLLSIGEVAEPLRRQLDGSWGGVVGDTGVLLPRELFEAFDLRPGDYVSVRAGEDGLELRSRRKNLARVRKELKQQLPDNVDLVGGLLAARREEDLRE